MEMASCVDLSRHGTQTVDEITTLTLAVRGAAHTTLVRLHLISVPKHTRIHCAKHYWPKDALK